MFRNDNPRGSRITSLQFINELRESLLLAGSGARFRFYVSV